MAESKNIDIHDILTFKFKVNCKIKSCPYITKSLKNIVMTQIDKIHMPIFKYARYSNITNWSTFVGMATARIQSTLDDEGISPITIDKIKDMIVKIKL